MSIGNVVKNGYCIGCGSCSIANNQNKIEFSGDIYVANLNGDQSVATKVCPFSDDAINEDELSKKFIDAPHFHEHTGYYEKLYALRVKDSEKINKSSSGGGVTWLIEKLFESKKIDLAFVVGESIDGSEMYGYRQVNNAQELQETRKSKYYPVTINSIKKEIINASQAGYRIAITGIPCFLKSIALLEEENLISRIDYKIALFCGHYKTTGFAKLLGMQLGVNPENLKNLDFRVKRENHPANDYFIKATSNDGKKSIGRVNQLYGANWGYGYFKPKACEFCDDICGEVADITFGDAWLDKYQGNPQGTNIVVVRNKSIDTLISESIELYREDVSVEDIYESQSANFRHRRGGAIIRKKFLSKFWTPKIRNEICEKYGDDRVLLYKSRWNLSIKSIENFKTASKFNSLLLFKILMSASLFNYLRLNRGINKSVVIAMKSVIKEILMQLKLNRRD
jgi:coenzyme F420 hydrogenase subunit beta